MKNFALTIFILLFLSVATNAQMPEADKEAKEAISKLAFITGEWSGSGWMMGADGQRHSFSQTEKIELKLDSTALLIEGVGKNGNSIVHNALAVVTWNKTDNNYNVRSYLSTGQGGDFKGELSDDRFTWFPNESLRYVIFLNQKGQWQETGEIKRGDDWFQFFEMTLNRKQK